MQWQRFAKGEVYRGDGGGCVGRLEGIRAFEGGDRGQDRKTERKEQQLLRDSYAALWATWGTDGRDKRG